MKKSTDRTATRVAERYLIAQEIHADYVRAGVADCVDEHVDATPWLDNLRSQVVAARYLTAKGALGPAIAELGHGTLNLDTVHKVLEALDIRPNGERWKVNADWYYGLGPRNQARANTLIRALVRLVALPSDDVDPVILKIIANDLKWLDKIKQADRTFKHGDFEISPMGVSGPDVQTALEALDKCAKTIRPKFSQLLYGKVFVTKTLPRSHTGAVASYTEDGDVLYLSTKAKGTTGDVYALCHEFGHRFFFKFWRDAERRKEFMLLSTTPEYQKIEFDAKLREKVADEYMGIADARRNKRPRPPPSEILLTWLDHKSSTPEYSKLQKLSVLYAKGEDVGQELRAVVLGKDFTLQTKELVRDAEYVTPYGKKGGWTENFAEAFAHLVLGMKMPPGIAAIMESL